MKLASIEHRALNAPPRAPGWDHSFALLADPYRFIGGMAERLDTPVFETRLLLQKTLCLSGARAAALFYDPERFERAGAAPEPLRATLFGHGTVQSLDGARHAQRKALFTSLMTPRHVAELVDRTRHLWLHALPAWRLAGPVSLYRALQPVLARAACGWAGVPLLAEERTRRSAQLVALFDGAASGPWRQVQARWARRSLEAWLAALVAAQRRGEAVFPDDSPADAACRHHEPDGTPLPPRVVAAELLNLLRPVVAVSLYMAFVVHALHANPAAHVTLAEAPSNARALAFVQEVRRHYPFFPAVAARVREDFEWRGWHFTRGRRALLDLFGTNHDAEVWTDPWRFDPERFLGRPPGAFDFVPQGGATVAHHRCPGEDVATQLMLLTLQMVLHEMRYRLPPQDLRLVMRRLPALPAQELLIAVS